MMVEALKLAFADRERWIGDPRFVDVPTAALLSDDYIASRRSLIRPGEAWPEMPPAGDPTGGLAQDAPSQAAAAAGPVEAAHDTSYVCAIDSEGNVFSATPSDISFDTPVIPGTGLCVSSRGAQSWADPQHASSVAPGKRPRLTPNPALAIKDGAFVIPFGTPGGDVQIQAMLQTFVNIVTYGMNPQAAVEAPRFATMSFPNSFEPHEYHPNKLMLEARIPEAAGEALAAWGHGVDWWPEWAWPAGAMCVLVQDIARGTISGRCGPAAARLRSRLVAGGSDKGAALVTIVFEGCRVFDGVSAEPRENATVVVENGRIKEVADGAVRAPADAERVACAGRTLMPGLIDAHFHALLVEITFSRSKTCRHRCSTSTRGTVSRARSGGGSPRCATPAAPTSASRWRWSAA